MKRLAPPVGAPYGIPLNSFTPSITRPRTFPVRVVTVALIPFVEEAKPVFRRLGTNALAMIPPAIRAAEEIKTRRFSRGPIESRTRFVIAQPPLELVFWNDKAHRPTGRLADEQHSN